MKITTFIRSHFDVDGYDNHEAPTARAIAEIFHSEIGKWRIPQLTKQTLELGEARTLAIQDWLQGLPSSCTLPCYYWEIEELIEKHRWKGVTTDNYWRICAEALHFMFYGKMPNRSKLATRKLI